MIDKEQRQLSCEEKVHRAAPPEVVARLKREQHEHVGKKKSQPLRKAMPAAAPIRQIPARLQRDDINDLYRARIRTVVERYILATERSPWSKPFRQKQAVGPMWHDPESVDKYVAETLHNLLRTLLIDDLL